MRYFTIVLLFSFSNLVYSQEINLQGQVSIHNSLYDTGTIEYVSNAYIRAGSTKPAITDDEGRFSLRFVGLETGTQVDVDVEKAGYEVVNAYELERVIIGRKLPLRVYLAKKGVLAVAQTELYKISKEALFASRDSTIARLERDSETVISDLEAQFGQEIGNFSEAKELINRKIESLERRLPETTQKLATVNLDFASALYKKAYQHFKDGEIKEAIEVLNEARLEQSIKDAVSQIAEGEKLEGIGKELQEKGQLQFYQELDSYRLKLESHYLLFEYRDALRIQETIVQI